MKALRLGLFLGWRQIQRASIWSTTLIIVIILFTFLNLVVLSGILMGIVDGAVSEVRSQALGDVNILPLEGETRVQETERFLQVFETYDEIHSYSPRYVGLATIEANFLERRRLSDEPDVIAVHITGIDPVAEDATTRLSELIVEGEYLDPDESGYILLGKYNVDRYANEFGNVFDSLKDIYPGDPVLVTVGGQTREFIVKGIVDSKVDYVAIGVYMPELEFRRMFDRIDHNANQITVRLRPGHDEMAVRDRLRSSDLALLAKINSFTEDIPKFVIDVRDTFNSLSLIVGAMSITVASITIFIVVFINALSRRRQIGILKAIGITHQTIQYAYVAQALFYVLIGSIIGIAITHFTLVPYFIEQPIDFPFSDTSLSITTEGMLLRALALLVVACAAGYVPARMITKQNTLSAILGRK
jgi:ABC-type lipoprotein release transport system permease subunit